MDRILNTEEAKRVLKAHMAYIMANARRFSYGEILRLNDAINIAIECIELSETLDKVIGEIDNGTD